MAGSGRGDRGSQGLADRNMDDGGARNESVCPKCIEETSNAEVVLAEQTISPVVPATCDPCCYDGRRVPPQVSECAVGF